MSHIDFLTFWSQKSQMPLLQIKTNTGCLSQSLRSELQSKAATVLSEEIGKSLDFVMVIIETGKDIYFAGSAEPACYMEIKNVGTLPAEKTEKISQRLCLLAEDKLLINPDRCFLEYQESPRHLWGWNAKTFAS
jgi:phenylpyruvate tautomerase PptA (4-oxalocrotonate tautomerase family)